MAAHHHHHHHQPIPAAATCYPTAAKCCCVPPPSHPPSQHPTTESATLIQALTSLLIQQQQSPPDSKPHHEFHNPNPKAQNFKHPKPNLHQQRQDQHYHDEDPHFILSSLTHRIDALESSLHHFSVSASSRSPLYSLRDTAARVIQIHFRAFLVRRSSTLRQLKQLGFIKSLFNSLKLCVSKRTHFDFDAVSSKSMELLIDLDSIQGGDPMIRDGKRSISRDLVRFLDFIDGISVKRQGVLYRAVKNVRSLGKGDKARVLKSKCGDSGADRREVIENLKDRVRKISGLSRVFDNDEESVELEGFHQVICDDEEQNPYDPVNGKGRNGILAKNHGGQDRVKKSVSFAKNGNVYRVFAKTNGSVLVEGDVLIDGSDSSEELAEEEKLSNEIEDNEDDSRLSEAEEEEEHSEDGGSSSHSSDAWISPHGGLRGEARFQVGRDSQGRNGNLVFAAPVTLKMESRDDLVKKKKALKSVS